MHKNVFKKQSSIIFTCVAVYFYIVTAGFQKFLPANTPPEVLITKPSSKERFNWNSPVPYSISVSDKEDGLSEYNEIEPKEVLLKIFFLPDSNQLNSYLAKESTNSAEPEELSLMKTSTCFNCHSVKEKLIGPSYISIAKKYSPNAASVKLLASRVIKGSKNIWGPAEMPPHPELTGEQANKLIEWMLKNCLDSSLDYVPGVEGAFKTKPKPAMNAGKGVYILTASYTDHGLTDAPEQKKRGAHTVVLRSFP